MWHKKVKKGPKLCEVVLQRSSCEQQPSLRVETDQSLPPLTLKVFDIVRLVKDHVVPFLSFECKGILHG